MNADKKGNLRAQVAGNVRAVQSESLDVKQKRNRVVSRGVPEQDSSSETSALSAVYKLKAIPRSPLSTQRNTYQYVHDSWAKLDFFVKAKGRRSTEKMWGLARATPWAGTLCAFSAKTPKRPLKLIRMLLRRLNAILRWYLRGEQMVKNGFAKIGEPV